MEVSYGLQAKSFDIWRIFICYVYLNMVVLSINDIEGGKSSPIRYMRMSFTFICPKRRFKGMNK